MNYVSWSGFALPVNGLLGLGVSGPGYRVGFWGFKAGIGSVKYLGYISVAAFVVCCLSATLWAAGCFPGGLTPALVGLGIAGFISAWTLKWKHNLDSRINVRSVSRVGKSDVGTNARRMNWYLARVTQTAI